MRVLQINERLYLQSLIKKESVILGCQLLLDTPFVLVLYIKSSSSSVILVYLLRISLKSYPFALQITCIIDINCMEIAAIRFVSTFNLPISIPPIRSGMLVCACLDIYITTNI